MQVMKYILRFGLFVVLNLHIYLSYGQEIVLGKYNEVYAGDIFITKPKWDRTGTKLGVTGESNKGIYVLNLSDKNLSLLSDKAGIGRNVSWSGSNEVVYRKADKLKTINNEKDGVGISNDTFLYVDPRKKRVCMAVSGTKIRKPVTFVPKLYYHPVLSPDKKKMVVHYKSEMFIMNIEDSCCTKNIGFGIASSWSNDGSAIYFFRDKTTDGHQISNSDLFVYSIAEDKIYELSSTDQYFEMWPDVSPDGKHIVFADEKTGKIFTAKILQIKR
jgi:Tol biopolymer transport system component